MIDWGQIEQLQEDIGPDDFQEVVTLFLEEVEQGIECLNQHARAQDLSNALHFLKGSALNLGFDRFSFLCAKGEQVAADGSMDVDLNAVISSFEKSKAMFIAELSKRLAA